MMPDKHPEIVGASHRSLLNVLILEDRPADAELMVRELRRAGFDPEWLCVQTETEYLAHLGSPIDLILADHTLPQFNARRALLLLQQRGLDIPFIIVTGTVSDEAAVECLKQGAADYLLKDRLARLGQAVARALQEKQGRDAARRAAESLARNEQLFRVLAENSRDAIYRYRLDPPGFDYMSPSITAITGYTPDEHYADPELISNIVHADDRKLLGQLITGEVSDQTVVLRWVHKDGGIIWTEHNTVSVRDGAGNTVAIEGSARDVTGRHRMMEAIEAEHAFRVAIEDSMVAGVAAIDLDGRQTYVNPAFCHMVGWSQQDLVEALPPFSYWPVEETETIKRQFQKALDGETLAGVELVFQRRSGERFDALVLASPLLDGSGQRTGSLATVYDITQRKRAERERQESEERYRALAEAAHDAIFIVGRGGHLLYANSFAASQLGARPQDLVGKRLGELFPADHSESQMQSLEQVFRAGEPLYVERETPYPGRKVWLGTWFVPLRSERGQVSAVLGLARDITEGKSAHEELARRYQEVDALFRVSRSVASSIGLKAVATEALATTMQVLRLDGGVIRYLDETSGDLVMLASLAMPDGFVQELGSRPRLKAGEGITSMAVRTGEPVVIPDARRDPRAAYQSLLGSEFQSFVCIPLKVQHEVVGTIASFCRTERTLSQRELDMATSIGNVVGMAIANARLFDQAETRAQEWERTFNGMSDGIFILSPEYRIVRANRALAAMLGTTPDALIGQQCYAAIHGGNAPIAECVGQRCLAGEGKCELVRQEPKLGDRWLEVSAEPITGAQGNVVSIIHTIKDVTEQRQAQETLRLSEEQSRRLAEQNEVLADIARIASSSLDIGEVYEQCAHEVAKLVPFDRMVVNLVDVDRGVAIRAYRTGVQVPDHAQGTAIPLAGSLAGQVVHHGLTLLVQGKDTGDLATRFPQAATVLQAGLRSFLCVPLVARETVIGVVYLISLQADAYLPEHAHLVERVASQMAGAVANAKLYAQLKEAEQYLRLSERRYRSLVEAAGAWIVRADRQQRITYVSAPDTPEFKEAQELTQEGRIMEAMASEDRQAASALFERVFMTGSPVRGFTFRLTLGGQVRHISSHWEPIRDSAGNVVEVQITGLDVTEQKRLEERYYQAQKMESVGRLAGGVAHDFNNLLTAILGYAEIGQTAVPQDSPLRPYFDEIHGAGERAASLTRQLLAFSRRQTFQPKTICLADLVTNLAKMLRRLIAEDTELDIPATQDVWPVKADPGQIEQVLVNLAVNARDAMPGGGKLTIKVANISLDQEYAQQHSLVSPGDYVVVAVTDTGVGMSPEVKEHLFEPFFTTKSKGTGLGLATCYGIIKQSGGHVSVYSELGLGTTVRFYLPRTAEATAGGTQAPPAAFPRGNETILLAEDEAAVRELTATALRHLGYSVIEASGSTEALRHLQEHTRGTVHLLLTDVVMPQMRGKELADKVRALRPGIRVLFMSGYASEAITRGGELEPGALLLQKPFTPSSLGQKVRQVLDG